MFPVPSVCNVGDSSQHTPPINPVNPVAKTRSVLLDVAYAWRSTRASINARLMPMAETRKPFGKSSAGVRITHSDLTYSIDGCSMKSKKLATTSSANVCTKRPSRLGIISTNRFSRRCSLRSTASTEPNIATHKKAMDATSSIQITGFENT